MHCVRSDFLCIYEFFDVYYKIYIRVRNLDRSFFHASKTEDISRFWNIRLLAGTVHAIKRCLQAVPEMHVTQLIAAFTVEEVSDFTADRACCKGKQSASRHSG